MKQMRFEGYLDEEEIGGGYRYKGGLKKYISLEQMKEKKIDFLDKVISEEDINQYYFCVIIFMKAVICIIMRVFYVMMKHVQLWNLNFMVRYDENNRL